MTEQQRRRQVERAMRLLDASLELHAKQHDTLREMRNVLAGEMALGDHMKAIATAFCDAWQARYRTKYQWAVEGAKNGQLLKKLLAGMDSADIIARIDIYVRDTDPFIERNRHSFGLFVSGINRYTPAAPEGDLELAAVDESFDCRHTPRCKSVLEHTRKASAELKAGAF